jgi:hypothetical protein
MKEMLIVKFSTFMLKTLSKAFKLKGHILNFGNEELKHTYSFLTMFYVKVKRLKLC